MFFIQKLNENLKNFYKIIKNELILIIKITIAERIKKNCYILNKNIIKITNNTLMIVISYFIVRCY